MPDSSYHGGSSHHIGLPAFLVSSVLDQEIGWLSLRPCSVPSGWLWRDLFCVDWDVKPWLKVRCYSLIFSKCLAIQHSISVLVSLWNITDTWYRVTTRLEKLENLEIIGNLPATAQEVRELTKSIGNVMELWWKEPCHGKLFVVSFVSVIRQCLVHGCCGPTCVAYFKDLRLVKGDMQRFFTKLMKSSL